MNKDRQTLDLFDWTPPAITPSFPARLIRAASLRAMASKALSISLKDSGKPRDRIAEEMASYLGEPCSKAMVDAYASEAREEHSIPLIRFIGVINATRDIRLLNMIAELFGWAVVPARYLPAIEEAMLAEKIEELQQRKTAARRSWKGGL